MKPHELKLTTPLSEGGIRKLRIGDAVVVHGTVYTARDMFHRHAAGGGACPVDLRGAVLYHCGPVVIGKPGRWRVIAAGPTTSIREEPYMSRLIAGFGIRMIIGKGGMGVETQRACVRYGCVYVQATGGAAQFLRRRISSVEAVHFLDEFGPAEALWELRAAGLPGIVAMDARGNSLYAKTEADSRRRLKELCD